MFDSENTMQLTFLDEAQSLIDDTEAAFIALDEGDHSPELVDRIFRLAHNFKSSAKTVGFNHLSDFAHVFEDVLTKIKSGALQPDRLVCGVLLETLDHIRSYVRGLREDLTYQHDVSMITEILLELANDDGKPVSHHTPGSGASSSEGGAPHEAATAFVQAAATSTPSTPPPKLATVNSGTPSNSQTVARNPSGKATEDENLRVSRRKLDDLLNLIGELVVSQSMVTSHRSLGTLGQETSLPTLKAMEKIVHEIQVLSLSLRMTPIAPLFQKLKRIARDASASLSKTIIFQTEGEHVELDKVVMDQISDPLTHLIRNAVDHGIETDVERVEKGKNTTATVTLKAQQQEDRIVITVSDNGRGLNPTKLIAKAIEKGLIQSTDQLSDEQAYALIFKPGFSTKEQVTDMSGRGVGMDVVHKSVTDLKGTIQVQTKLGEGTQFIISLPLSMAILTGMVVSVDQQKYVVPISQLVETVELKKFSIETSTGDGRMFNLRGEVIPICSLSSILHPDRDMRDRTKRAGTVLITSYQGKKISFEIDQICGQQEIVLKKLGHEMRDLPGIVAGAILSTGEPGFVLNLTDFVEKGVGRVA